MDRVHRAGQAASAPCGAPRVHQGAAARASATRAWRTCGPLSQPVRLDRAPLAHLAPNPVQGWGGGCVGRMYLLVSFAIFEGFSTSCYEGALERKCSPSCSLSSKGVWDFSEVRISRFPFLWRGATLVHFCYPSLLFGARTPPAYPDHYFRRFLRRWIHDR